MAEETKFVEIGFTAFRNPDGSFKPPIPMYIQVPASEVDPKTGIYTGQDQAMYDVGKIFAEKFKQYVDAGGLTKGRGKRDQKSGMEAI